MSTSLRLISIALSGAVLLGCSGSDSTPPSDGGRVAQTYGEGWSAVHADAGNSDYSPVRGARNLKLAWQRVFTGNVNLGPTSDPWGQTYVTVNALVGCALYALDSATGETVWCSEEVDRFAAISSPLIDREGNLYLADGSAMHAFRRDGTVLWETPIQGVPLSAQFTAQGNVVFVTHIGYIYLLDRRSGANLVEPLALDPGATWNPALGVGACATGRPECPSANTPAIDPATGRFIFTFWTPGAQTSGIRAVQVSEGAAPSLTPLWTNESLPEGSASSPTLSADGSRVYVTDNAGSLHALSTRSGDMIWSFEIGYPAAGSPSRSPEGLIMPAGGRLGAVMAIADRGDHAELAWRNDTLINGGISTQAAGGLAYVTAFGAINELVVVDTRDGTELDREPLIGVTGFTVGTTVGLDGTVYVPAFLGELFAFRPDTGVAEGTR
ncbi:MAG: PQQ-binding-like beta-propeller repeat protein [Sinimarinibacterium sp.]|jgi:outer membrane protein assembly factor BamB